MSLARLHACLIVGTGCLLQLTLSSALQHVRLLAVVLAKNAVGSSWRKTLGTREWSRIPDDEKEYVRSAAASLLFEEPQKRVATQTSLLIANIARFDFPGRWPTLLSGLTEAGSWDGDAANEQTVERNDRALFTLKHVIRAVKSKRIVVETPTSSGGSVSTAGTLMALINADCEFHFIIRPLSHLSTITHAQTVHPSFPGITLLT